MKYNDLNKAINKHFNKEKIVTKDDIIDYCKMLAYLNKMDLFCNNIEIKSIVIDIENNRINFDF